LIRLKAHCSDGDDRNLCLAISSFAVAVVASTPFNGHCSKRAEASRQLTSVTTKLFQDIRKTKSPSDIYENALSAMK
jgi:hypothetical protein